MIFRVLVLGLALLMVVGRLTAQPPAEERKIEDRNTNVKKQTKFTTNSRSYSGEAVRVTAESVTVRWGLRGGRTVLSQVFPIDLLADGKIVDGVSGSYSYRWSDIQMGDVVNVEVMHDDGDGRDYCIGVSISAIFGIV